MKRVPLLLAALVVTGSCSSPPQVTVLAASALGEAMEAVASELRRADPPIELVVSTAGSQTLAAQILAGAPTDLFLAADREQMQRVLEAGLVAGRPQVVAASRLVIVVAPGNPLGIAGLSDLADPGLTVVLATEEVPAGSYTRQALQAAGVTVSPDSLETSVRAVLTKVAIGEADAGMVYAADVHTRLDVAAVEIPEEHNVQAVFRAAVLTTAPQPQVARRVLSFLTSPAGRAILTEHGFQAP